MKQDTITELTLTVDDIYHYAEQLKATVHRYENTGQRYENPQDSQIVQNED